MMTGSAVPTAIIQGLFVLAQFTAVNNMLLHNIFTDGNAYIFLQLENLSHCTLQFHNSSKLMGTD
jgi:hypothetical protein